ncbi:MAG: FHA domain-containing protein [Planctomycetota bacterium]
MSGFLSLADGGTLAVRDGLVIGRGAGCDLVIDDGKASRRHLRVIVEAGVVEIEDLGSSNGTLLNGKPVTRRVLRDGDQVQIGATVIAYREGSPAAAAMPRGSARSAPVPDDDNDLFGDGGAATASAPPAASRPAPPAPAPASAPAPTPAPASRPAPPAPPASPPPSPRAPAVVEFADEIVAVRRPQAAPARPAAAAKGAAAEPVVEARQRVLQYSKHSGGGGVLGDDLGQMSSGVRALIVALVLAAAAGLAYGVIHLVR